jgi:hypothetical protein
MSKLKIFLGIFILTLLPGCASVSKANPSDPDWAGIASEGRQMSVQISDFQTLPGKQLLAINNCWEVAKLQIPEEMRNMEYFDVSTKVTEVSITVEFTFSRAIVLNLRAQGKGYLTDKYLREDLQFEADRKTAEYVRQSPAVPLKTRSTN